MKESTIEQRRKNLVNSMAIGHEAGLRYKAWKKKQKKHISYVQAAIKYDFYKRQVTGEFKRAKKL